MKTSKHHRGRCAGLGSRRPWPGAVIGGTELRLAVRLTASPSSSPIITHFKVVLEAYPFPAATWHCRARSAAGDAGGEARPALDLRLRRRAGEGRARLSAGAGVRRRQRSQLEGGLQRRQPLQPGWPGLSTPMPSTAATTCRCSETTTWTPAQQFVRSAGRRAVPRAVHGRVPDSHAPKRRSATALARSQVQAKSAARSGAPLPSCGNGEDSISPRSLLDGRALLLEEVVDGAAEARVDDRVGREGRHWKIAALYLVVALALASMRCRPWAMA